MPVSTLAQPITTTPEQVGFIAGCSSHLAKQALVIAVWLFMSVVLAPSLWAQSGAWSMDEYGRLSGDMELLDDSLLLAHDGTDEWRELTLEAIDVRRALIGLLTRSVRDGSLPDEFRESAASARLRLIQNVVVFLTRLGDCDMATGALTLLDDAGGSSTQAVSEARHTAGSAVDACVPASTPAIVSAPADPSNDPRATGEPVQTTPLVAVETTPAQSTNTSNAIQRNAGTSSGSGGSGKTIGMVLIATGGTMLAGGLVMDAINAAGPRSEFNTLREQCPGNCDTARMNELSTQIRTARAPIGTLVFGGLGVAVTGAIIYAISPRAADRIAIAPLFGRDIQGATVRVRF